MKTNIQPPRTAHVQRQVGGRMSLSAVTRGTIDAPLRACLYGTEGIGKSTWASQAPSPIFLCSERGTERINVARMPEPLTWDEVFEAIGVLESDPHDFQTLVIDTLDWLEPLCHAYVAQKSHKPSIIDIEYGRGYEYALQEWRRLFAAVERLQDVRGMHLVLLAHAHIKTFKNPEGEDFDRYQLKIHDKAAGLVKEWVEDLLFAAYETFASKLGKSDKAKGVSTGERIVRTERAAAFDAKNRHSLPQRLPLDWSAYYGACMGSLPAQAEEPAADEAKALRLAIYDLAEKAGVEQSAVAAVVEKAGNNLESLAKIEAKLSARLTAQTEE